MPRARRTCSRWGRVLLGALALSAAAAQFGEKIRVELAKWEKVVKPLGIKPE